MKEANIIPFGKRGKINLKPISQEDRESTIDPVLDLASDIEEGRVSEYSLQVVYADGKTHFHGWTTISPGRMLKVMAEARSDILDIYNHGFE